jgi:iron complex outermembrane recepter protein
MFTLMMLHSLPISSCAIAAVAVEPADAMKRHFDVPAGDARPMLRRFARQANREIVFAVDNVTGITTHAVEGEFTVPQALEHMLSGTGLVPAFDAKTGAIAIQRASSPPPNHPRTPEIPTPASPDEAVATGSLAAAAPSENTNKPGTATTSNHESMKRKTPLAALATWLGLSLLSPAAPAATPMTGAQNRVAATATISGTVANSATGNLLEGVTVSIPSLGLTALTDNTGHFAFTNVPTGRHELTASYLGLNTARAEVNVADGERATRNLELTTGIYQMSEFKVTGEREGSAAAIVAQRNAPNVKNVVSMDQFGYLPNMSVDQMIIRLPGVTASVNENFETGEAIQIRGQAQNLNRFTVDGAPTADHGGFTRLFQGDRFNGAMFDQIELTKGHTPDQPADSLGGTVNLKTRSPLSMKEKRRFGYNLAARWAPPFFDYVPARREHRVHPLINASYQEVFSVLGGDRNLAVAVNGFWSENFVANYRTDTFYQNTLASPAYTYQFNARDSYRPLYTGAGNVKIDYRHSPTTKFTLGGVYNSWLQARIRNKTAQFQTAQSVGITGTAGILPGYTDYITEARPVATSFVQSGNDTLSRNRSITRSVDFTGEHELNRLKIDYRLGLSYMLALFPADGGGGDLSFRVTGVGWRIDRTQSDLYPRIIQTSGPDITDPNSYEPNGFLNSRNNNGRYNRIKNVSANLRYDLPTAFPLAVKTGAAWRENNVGVFTDGSLRWSYIGTGKIPHDPNLKTSFYEHTGLRIPFWNTEALVKNLKPVQPELWREDVYFRESSKYTGTRGVREQVAAGYLMTQGKVGRLGFLAGVRSERTDNNASGWVRAHSPSTAAQQAADPFGAVARDYANTFRRIEGGYTKSFPSAHLSYDVTPNLKARLSWSTSFARPDMNNLLPNETFSDVTQILTINNPALKPQLSENWDATLDYYFEPVGNVSVGWFHKDIRDYILRNVVGGIVGSGTDNGYNGEYAGYEIRTSRNAGGAVVQGWEFSYQQQLTFLPGLLKGLSVGANYTLLDSQGNFGGTVNLASGAIPGFIPRAGNVSLAWRYRAFNVRVLYNQNAAHFLSLGSTPALNVYKTKVRNLTLGFGYQYRPWLGFTCDLTNALDEPVSRYTGLPHRLSQVVINGPKLEVGVNGRF